MTGQRTDGAPVTLPKTFWRKLLGSLAVVFMIVSLSSAAMAESAAAAVPGSGYVTITPAQCGVTVVGNNIVPNSDPAVFTLIDNQTGKSQAGPPGAKFKVPASLFIPRSTGPYDYLVLGSNGYAQRFTGTVSCSTNVPGKGHVESSISCTGKAGVDLVATNDTPNSSAISFTLLQLMDNGAILDLSINFKDVQYGTPAFFHQTMSLGTKYSYSVTGPDGYAEKFAGTLCPPPAPTDVTPNAPTFHDVDGTVNDTYTIVPTPGVVYSVNGNSVTGTKPGVGTVTVTAAAASSDYVITGKSSWPFTFTNNQPAPITVAPNAPVFDDQNNKFTVPSSDCFAYTVGGDFVKPNVAIDGKGLVVVVAELKNGCVLKEGAQTSFPHTFVDKPPVMTSVAPPAVTFSDTDKSFTIPASSCFVYGLPRSDIFIDPGSHSHGPGYIKIVATVKGGSGCVLKEGAQTEFDHTFLADQSTTTQPAPTTTATAQTPAPSVAVVPAAKPSVSPVVQPSVATAPPVANTSIVQFPAGNDLNPGFNAKTGWDEAVAPSAPHRFNYRLWAGVFAGMALAFGVGAIFTARKSGEESA